jgi:hypothetical protein
MRQRETNLDREKVNLETAPIPWTQLQRFFANGTAVYVANELDLIEVAYQFAIDNKNQVAQWLESKQLGLVSDQQAINWLEADVIVWAVVVKPLGVGASQINSDKTLQLTD